ncbi:hypothetical protein CGZ94_17655 [Enemella evansiae]|uniref:ABC transmembrane type-1 domain-containing protein n=1 Tax=Enemella evansiae TaxID=2016499 RepID=A0A255G0W1_9ACTN|nr:sugar ABC transporter permease [Enemella evansiae]OYO09505.1 hypothetical protein CGZ94_17655 [Enemella evansiae]
MTTTSNDTVATGAEQEAARLLRGPRAGRRRPVRDDHRPAARRTTAPPFWPFVAPALVVYLVLYVGPALFGLGASFTRWQGLGSPMSFDGLGNYVRMLRDPGVGRALLNTGVLMVVGLLGVLAVSMVALLVLQRMRGRRFVRVVIFIPYLISPIAIGVAFGFLLDPEGLLNSLLSLVRLEGLRQSWLGPDLVFQCVILAVIWSLSGLAIVLLMAAVDNIPHSLYENADLAGATALQRLTHITVPLSRGILGVVVTLCMIQLMKVFDLVYTLTGATGVPPYAARTFAVEQYVTLAPVEGRPDFGYGAAMGVAFVILVTVLVVAMRRIMRSETIEY